MVATVSNLSGFVQRLARPNLRSALRRRVKMRPFLTLANCKCRSVTHLYLLRHSVARLLARSAIGSPAHSFVKLCAWWLIHDIIQASGWIFDVAKDHEAKETLVASQGSGQGSWRWKTEPAFMGDEEQMFIGWIHGFMHACLCHAYESTIKCSFRFNKHCCTAWQSSHANKIAK